MSKGEPRNNVWVFRDESETESAGQHFETQAGPFRSTIKALEWAKKHLQESAGDTFCIMTKQRTFKIQTEQKTTVRLT